MLLLIVLSCKIRDNVFAINFKVSKI
jgi:hypothetical protein